MSISSVNLFHNNYFSVQCGAMNQSQSNLLRSLNPEQQQAVSAPPGNILVHAGAGSGKTRVLVHRIAWLMEQEQISPYAILAVTFTNKAAYEMRGRIESLLGMSLSAMWVGTFHGLAHRLLRAHWQEAKLSQAFQILDTDDQQRLVRRLMKGLNLDEAKWPPKQAVWFINKHKEEGRRSHQVPEYGDIFTETMRKIYRLYEETCQQSGLVDFAELLLRSLELLQNNSEIQEHYRSRFRHILVDEFQDTNTIQYIWLRALAGPDSYMMAVGDDDQSIYSWRGAKVENIHRFTRDFPNTQTIRLEQNYRSTQTILNAANAVIENNSSRLGKKLWTEGNTGQPITLYSAFNEYDEAHFVVSTIREWVQDPTHHYSDIAVLYRSNAQSRVLEEQLVQSQIAYRIYGGLKFFERAEIKDALAYLRLIANRHDDAAFERVVNLPTRGIGNTTLALLREHSHLSNASLWQSAQYLISDNSLSSRASSSLNQFLSLINTLDQDIKHRELGKACEGILEGSGLLEHYRKDKSESGQSRVENLEELINAMSSFKPDHAISATPLIAFLAHVALETGEGQADPHSDCVSLMTLHSAKGLEFKVVIITGMEENLFPHRMSIEENKEEGLQEERRLCYVGMTRAMQRLFLAYSECRRLHGSEIFNNPSRFIREIPSELIYQVRPTTKISRTSDYRDSFSNSYLSSSSYSKKPKYRNDTNQSSIADPSMPIGKRVRHKKFGTGVILNYEGSDEHMRIQVKFEQHGTKWLVASFANLEII